MPHRVADSGGQTHNSRNRRSTEARCAQFRIRKFALDRLSHRSSTVAHHITDAWPCKSPVIFWRSRYYCTVARIGRKVDAELRPTNSQPGQAGSGQERWWPGVRCWWASATQKKVECIKIGTPKLLNFSVSVFWGLNIDSQSMRAAIIGDHLLPRVAQSFDSEFNNISCI
jgi:hypothetical protein